MAFGGGFTGGPWGGPSGGVKPGYAGRGSKGGGGAPSRPSSPTLSPATTTMSFPAAAPFDPYEEDPRLAEDLGAMSEYGKGLMDPESDYYRRMSAEMQRQIGEQAGAQGRGAALRGAWSGMGAGASPELMATQADISQAGLEAQGVAESGLRLEAPKLGAGMVQSTFGPRLGVSRLGEESRRYGAGMAEGARQFGAGLGMRQQEMAADRAAREAALRGDYDRMNFEAEQARLDREAREREIEYSYGGGGGGGGGSPWTAFS